MSLDPDKYVRARPRKSKAKGIASLPAAIPILRRFEGPYACLSPSFMAKCHLAGEAASFPSVAHALQASKSNDKCARHLIRTCETVADAKTLCAKMDLTSWNKSRLQIMEQLLRDKFMRHRHLRRILLKTKGKELFHENKQGDMFWGVCREKKKGKNQLGQLLMKIRREIIQNEVGSIR